ncbi:MAG: 5'-3' exonuclease H3TH domain-containing protein [Acidobacteriota bacterium]
MQQSLFLVDASPYIFRAYFSVPSSITTPSGAPANAVHGFGAFLLRLLQEEKPTHIAVAFDGSLTTSFRNEIYPDYKAQRELPPPELEAQQRGCQQMARALGCPSFIDDRYEADDLVATLKDRCANDDGLGCVVVTSDKDLAQLVDERTQLFDFAKAQRFGPAEVIDKFGVRPEQIVDYLGLAGDAVDNIPGVRGIGAKSAAALLQAKPSLDALYEDLGSVEALPVRGAKRLRRLLEEQETEARLSRELATVSTEAPVDVELAQLAYEGIDSSALETLCEEYGFTDLRRRAEELE